MDLKRKQKIEKKNFKEYHLPQASFQISATGLAGGYSAVWLQGTHTHKIQMLKKGNI